MKKLVLCLVPILFIACFCTAKVQDTLVLSSAAVRAEVVPENWLFSHQDLPGMKETDFIDSGWYRVNSDLSGDAVRFDGVGWFRSHIYATSDLTKVPLALQMEHDGASEVYLDGRKIAEFGRIASEYNTVYERPGKIPVIFSLPDSGHHVIAVRYANYRVSQNEKYYAADYGGFELSLGVASDLVANQFMQTNFLTFVLVLFFGVFLALSVAHFFMYLFEKSVVANRYFSILCFSLALLFLSLWLRVFAGDPRVAFTEHFVVPVLASAFCYSMSGFVNTQFGSRSRRFRAITILCLVTPLIFYFYSGPGLILMAVVIIVVMAEAIILIIRALYRRVKGAGIIGVGMLLFAIFVFLLTVYLTVNGGISFEGGSNAGLIAFVVAAAAFLGLPASMSLFLAWSFAAVNKELQHNLEQVRELSEKTIQQEKERIRMVESQKEELETEVVARTAEVVNQKEEIEKQHDELKAEKKRSDDLLLNILPEEIAEELKQKGHTDARLFNNVTVLFTDFVDFTRAGERMSPQELVDELHSCFKAFDEIIQHYGIEKIKTIGDAYLAVAGVPRADDDHADHVVKAALEIRNFILERKRQLGDRTFEVRIGIHSGSVVAGIVGIKKFAYDIWGDTVNTAARMEQSSEAGRINISEATYDLVKEHFICRPRGRVEAKNKGELNMYFVEGLR